MDLTKFDLYALINLWNASNYDLELRKLIEVELQSKILVNDNFSREYLFQICKVKKHAITISFIPTTDSYIDYGSQVTVDIILNDKEMEEMINNYSAKPSISTNGKVKAKVLFNHNLTQEQIKKLETIGFNTKDIFETAHL